MLKSRSNLLRFRSDSERDLSKSSTSFRQSIGRPELRLSSDLPCSASALSFEVLNKSPLINEVLTSVR